MNLAGFCRNCLTKGYPGAAGEHGVSMDYDTAREMVCRMPYGEWIEKYQTDAFAEQQQAFNDTRPLHAYVRGDNK